MKIMFMAPELDAPSEIWMQRMLEEIQDDLGVIVTEDSKKKKFWRDVKVVSLNDNPLINRVLKRVPKMSGIINSVQSPKSILYREIKKSKPDCILCNYGTFAVRFFDVWKKIDTPLFVHFHGYDATFDYRSHQEPNLLFHDNKYLEQIIELSNRAIYLANSNHMQVLLVNAGIDPKRIIVKYLGVPIPSSNRMYPDPQGEIKILQVGRLVDCKSPDRTIKAFEIARSKGLNGKLIIVGDGPLRVTCELARMRSPYKDSIFILGVLNAIEVQKIMASADIYTQHNIKGELSHQDESLGVSILEAMANELPVVGTKSGGVQETVKDGKTGILVTPGDVEAQAKALLFLGQNVDLRHSIGKEARLHVSENFSCENEKQQLKQILRKK